MYYHNAVITLYIIIMFIRLDSLHVWFVFGSVDVYLSERVPMCVSLCVVSDAGLRKAYITEVIKIYSSYSVWMKFYCSEIALLKHIKTYFIQYKYIDISFKILWHESRNKQDDYFYRRNIWEALDFWSHFCGARWDIKEFWDKHHLSCLFRCRHHPAIPVLVQRRRSVTDE